MLDQWTQKLSLFAVAVITLVALYAINTGAACWCPSHFTPSHVRFTDSYCAKHHNHFRAIALARRNLTHQVDPSSQDTILLKYLAGEAFVACVLFALLQVIMTCSSFDVKISRDSHKHYSKAPPYICLQALGILAWILFAVFTYTSFTPSSMVAPEEPFLCNFSVRVLGRRTQHSIECVDAGESMMRLAVMANVGVCVVVAFTKVVHLMAIFGIQPLLTVNKMAIVLQEKRIIQSSEEIGLAFGYSDLYFALVNGSKEALPPTILHNLPKRDRPYSAIVGEAKILC